MDFAILRFKGSDENTLGHLSHQRCDIAGQRYYSLSLCHAYVMNGSFTRETEDSVIFWTVPKDADALTEG